MTRLETERLILRPWHDADRTAFAEMSADGESMQYLGGRWDRATSDNFIDRCKCHAADHGYGVQAIELKETGAFIGFAGLKNVTFTAHFTPAIEIGWRLARPYWNNGYATEAAQNIATHSFNDMNLDEIISYVTPKNRASLRVMEKLGMQRDGDSFKHPSMKPEDPLAEMVLYRLKKSVAMEKRSTS